MKLIDMLPSGGFFAFWDGTHPSPPLPQTKSVKKGGGTSASSGNRP